MGGMPSRVDLGESWLDSLHSTGAPHYLPLATPENGYPNLPEAAAGDLTNIALPVRINMQICECLYAGTLNVYR